MEKQISNATIINRNYTLNLFLKKYKIEDMEIYYKVSEFIQSIKNPRSKKTHLNNIMNLCKNRDQYEPLFKQVVDCCNMLTYHRDPNESEKNNYETWDAIIEKRDSLSKNSMEYLLLCFYTMIPPMRNEELHTLQLYTGDNTVDNIYNMDTKKMIIKKSKVNEKRTFNLPQCLIDVLDKYIETNKITTNIFSFTSAKTINKILSKIFKHNFGSSMIRKIFVSTFTKKMTLNEKRLLAHSMNHQPTTQYLVYTRFMYENDNLEEKKITDYMDILSIVEYKFLT